MNLTLDDLKELLCGRSEQKTEDTFQKGQCVFIRTVTNYFVGEVLRSNKVWVVLTKVSWVADTGRFTDAIAKGILNEVEPYPENMEVLVAIGSIVDVCPWKHDLPKEQK